jgi:hypothetical protein
MQQGFQTSGSSESNLTAFLLGSLAQRFPGTTFEVRTSSIRQKPGRDWVLMVVKLLEGDQSRSATYPVKRSEIVTGETPPQLILDAIVKQLEPIN